MGKSKISGITVKIDGDVTGLDKALDGTNQKIKTTQQDLKDVERLLKLDPTNTKLLEQRQKLLADAISETENKLDTLNKANEQAAGSADKYLAWKAAFDPIQDEISSTQQKLRELRDQQDEMKDLGEIDTDAYKQLVQEADVTAKRLKDLKAQAKAVKEEFGNPLDPRQYEDLQKEIAETRAELDKLSGKGPDVWKEMSKEVQSVQKELKEVDKLLEKNSSNVVFLEQKQELLTEAIAKTEAMLGLMADAYDEMLYEADNGIVKNARAFRELEREIEKARDQLDDLVGQASETERKLNGIDEDPVEDVADAAKEAKKALGEASEEASTFGDVLKAEVIVEGAKGLLSAAKDIAQDTKEYRKIMGSLEVSSEDAGYTAEQTQEAYKKLFGILADEQSAATTLANLQALGLEQSDLLKVIDSTVGGWAKYGDSIPIDGLAEAINETAKAGRVTGTFADVLNWGAKEGETYGVALREATEANEEWNTAVEACETAEDYFNLALQECATEAERVNLIMQAMADQGLAAAGQKWRENNASMVESNEVSADLQEQLAVLGEKIEPLVTRLTEMVVQALEWFNNLDTGTQNFVLGTVAMVAAIGPVASAVSGITSAVDGVMTILPKLQTSFSSVMGFIAANPIVLLIAAIVGLVALIATKGDEIQAMLQKVNDFVQNIFAKDWTEVFGPILGGALNKFFQNIKGIWDSIMLIFNGIIDFIRGVFTGDWERAWLGLKEIVGGAFQGLLNVVRKPINAVIELLNGVFAGIDAGIDFMNGIPGVDIGFRMPRIPFLANGGEVLYGNAVVGDGGPELLTVAGDRTIVQPLTSSSTHHATHLGGVNITVYGAPGQDVAALADIVAAKLQHAYESEEAAL